MTHCRGCKSTNLFLFLPLGDHPPANGFLSPDGVAEAEARFPLDAYVCLDCGLIQVADHVPADFFRHYVYLPSASPLMQEHFRDLARDLDRRFDRSRGHVVDIGCNDGTVLRAARDLGWRTLGIDPATNIVEAVCADGIEVMNEYLTLSVADKAVKRHGRAAVVVTTNTIHHIDDLDGFMRAVDRLLADDGTFVVEVPHAEKLLEQNEFDGIYHEHVSQMSVKSFVDLFRRFGMRVVDVRPLEVHGGSIRVFGEKGPSAMTPRAVLDLVTQEERAGLFRRETYVHFRSRVETLRRELLELLRSLKGQGRRIAAYGASARGNTLLNYYGIGPALLEFIADRNPLKHGLYSPGMHVPVRPAEALLEERPDFVLLLAWNFADEILRQQGEYLLRGGAFILPLPRVEVVDAASRAA